MREGKSGIEESEGKWNCLSGNEGITCTAVEQDAADRECKQTAFVQMAERHRASLLRLARRLTNCREDAEDIVQLSLMKAFANLSQFRGDAQMGTWLHAIVKNTAREFLRSHKGRVLLPLESFSYGDENPIVYDVPDPGKNPEEYCEHRELEDALLTELAELDSVCKAAIQMCVFDELPQFVAASVLNVSVSTIKSRIFRGKSMLKRAVWQRAGKPEGVALSMKSVP